MPSRVLSYGWRCGSCRHGRRCLGAVVPMPSAWGAADLTRARIAAGAMKSYDALLTARGGVARQRGQSCSRMARQRPGGAQGGKHSVELVRELSHLAIDMRTQFRDLLVDVSAIPVPGSRRLFTNDFHALSEGGDIVDEHALVPLLRYRCELGKPVMAHGDERVSHRIHAIVTAHRSCDKHDCSPEGEEEGGFGDRPRRHRKVSKQPVKGFFIESSSLDDESETDSGVEIAMSLHELRVNDHVNAECAAFSHHATVLGGHATLDHDHVEYGYAFRTTEELRMEAESTCCKELVLNVASSQVGDF
mmetsp:Transcript_85237/g.170282  ORF Transcript_85237/g.170282 Transcript_85237/m.170282 type:complete len:304 (-) Transcript_85237:279-1190(-)